MKNVIAIASAIVVVVLLISSTPSAYSQLVSTVTVTDNEVIFSPTGLQIDLYRDSDCTKSVNDIPAFNKGLIQTTTVAGNVVTINGNQSVSLSGINPIYVRVTGSTTYNLSVSVSSDDGWPIGLIGSTTLTIKDLSGNSVSTPMVGGSVYSLNVSLSLNSGTLNDPNSTLDVMFTAISVDSSEGAVSITNSGNRLLTSGNLNGAEIESDEHQVDIVESIPGISVPEGSDIYTMTEPGSDSFDSGKGDPSTATITSDGTRKFWICLDASGHSQNKFTCKVSIDGGALVPIVISGNDSYIQGSPGKAFIVLSGGVPLLSGKCTEDNAFKNVSVSVEIVGESKNSAKPIHLYVILGDVVTNVSQTSLSDDLYRDEADDIAVWQRSEDMADVST